MRKLILNNTMWFMAVFMFLSIPLSAATTPTFLILNESSNLNQQVALLEKTGSRVRQIVPPRIVVVDLAASLNISVQASYVGVISLATLEPLGPVAVAAGLRWNNSLVGKAKSSFSASAVTALVTKESLAAPDLTQAMTEGRNLICSWKASQGGLVYEIQLGSDPLFSQITNRTHTDKTSATLPIDAAVGQTFYIRVRAMDRPDANNKAADLKGAWSNTLSASVQSSLPIESDTPLTVTSPVEGMESSGFSLVLEWIASGAGKTRVQVSESSSFNSTLVDEVVLGEEYALPSTALHVGDNLYWRVKKWDALSSPWSTVRTLKIGAPRSSLNDTFVNPEAPR